MDITYTKENLVGWDTSVLRELLEAALTEGERIAACSDDRITIPDRQALKDIVEAHGSQAAVDQRAKEAQETEIRDRYAVLMREVVKPYTADERETWFVQVDEALAYLADNLATVPMITAMATARGITVLDMATKITDNNSLYRTTIGTLLGQQQAEIDAVWAII